MAELSEYGIIDGNWYEFELLGGGEVDRYLNFRLRANEGTDMGFTWTVSEDGLYVDVHCHPPGDSPEVVGEGEDTPGNPSICLTNMSPDDLRELSDAADMAADYLDGELDRD